jgi:hypothetical protein
MAASNKDRQEALRARRAMFGMTEVRGIYLHPDDHARVKRYAERLRKQREKSSSPAS